MKPGKHNLFTLVLLCGNLVASGAPDSVQRFEGTREMKIVEPAKPILTKALGYITSCKSSTPLNIGFGAPTSLSILEFRDLVASRPIIIIRPGATFKVPDKSGMKNMPPLDLIEITIVQIDKDQIRVFAHTATDGNLIEFREPSKDAQSQLHAEVNSTQAQQAAP